MNDYAKFYRTIAEMEREANRAKRRGSKQNAPRNADSWGGRVEGGLVEEVEEDRSTAPRDPYDGPSAEEIGARSPPAPPSARPSPEASPRLIPQEPGPLAPEWAGLGGGPRHERLGGIVSRNIQDAVGPMSGRPAWEAAAGLVTPAETLPRRIEGMPEATNADPSRARDSLQLFREDRAGERFTRGAGDLVRAPFDDNARSRAGERIADIWDGEGPVVLTGPAALVREGLSTVSDIAASPFDEGARRRLGDRTDFLGRFGRGIGENVVINPNASMADQEAASDEAQRQWLRDINVRQRYGEIYPEYGSTMDELVVEAPRPSTLRRVGAFADDMLGERANEQFLRDPMQDYGANDYLAGVARERETAQAFAEREAPDIAALRQRFGDSELLSDYERAIAPDDTAPLPSGEYERRARAASVPVGLSVGLSALEFVPGVGALPDLAAASRAGARGVGRAAWRGAERAGVVDAELPYAFVQREAGDPFFNEMGGAATAEARQSARNPALIAGGVGAGLAASDGDTQTATQVLGAGVGLAAANRYLGGPRRLGQAEAPLVAQPAIPAQPRIIEGEARVVPPGPARNFQAAIRDPETGQVFTGLDHWDAIESAPDAMRSRLEAIYNAPVEDAASVGFVVNGQFMGREDGMAAMRAAAGRRSAPQATAPRENASSVPDGGALGEPRPQNEVARRAPMSGRTFLERTLDEGVNPFRIVDEQTLVDLQGAINQRKAEIADAIEGVPSLEEIQRLGITYDETGVPRLPRQLSAPSAPTASTSRPGVRIGEQVNRQGQVEPASPIDWDSPQIRLPADEEELRSLAGMPPRGPGDTASAIGAGAIGGGAIGASLNSQAQAQDGSEASNDLLLPVLGAGGGAAALTALARGRRLGGGMRSQVGMFAGVNARTADRAALERAQAMATQGAARDDIWRETGWFQGVDGKWRFEIDDSGAQLSDPNRSRHVGQLAGRGGVLNHDALYQAYPEASEHTLAMIALAPDTNAAYAPSVGLIRGRAEDPRSVLLHEGQHVVQNAENFGRGGSLDSFTQQRDAQAARDALSWRREMERVARNNPNATPSQLDQIVQDEYYAMGAGDWIPAGDARFVAMDGAGHPNAQLEELVRAYGLDRRVTPMSPREGYRRLAGEVEARNVEARRDFTPEERRARPPWETQDVPDDQQIIRFEGGVQSMSGARPPVRRLEAPEPTVFDTSRNPVNPEQSAPTPRTNRPRGLAAGSQDYLARRNARILQMLEEMQPVRNASTGAANPNARLGQRLDNGYRAIAERMRQEGYGEVTQSVISGIVKRSRGRGAAPAASAAAEASDEATARELGMSVERYRQLSARRGTDSNAALLAAGGGAAGLLALGNAEAQEGPTAEEALDAYGPQQDYLTGQGFVVVPARDVPGIQGARIVDVDGNYFAVESGGRIFRYHRMRGFDQASNSETINDVLVGEIVPTQPRPTPKPETDGSEEDADWGAIARPITSAGIGLLAGSRVRRPAVGTAVAGTVGYASDALLGGEGAEPIVAASLAAGARGLGMPIADDFARENVIRRDRTFPGRRDAYAETLPDADTVRGMAVGPGLGRSIGRLETDRVIPEPWAAPSRAEVTVPGQEIAEEGYSRDLAAGPSPREMFESMNLSDQAAMMDRAAAREAEMAERYAAYRRLRGFDTPEVQPLPPARVPEDDRSFPVGFFDPATGQPLYGDAPRPGRQPPPRRERLPFDRLSAAGQARRIGKAADQIEAARTLGVGNFASGADAMRALRARAQSDPGFMQTLIERYPSVAALLLGGVGAEIANQPERRLGPN